MCVCVFVRRPTFCGFSGERNWLAIASMRDTFHHPSLAHTSSYHCSTPSALHLSEMFIIHNKIEMYKCILAPGKYMAFATNMFNPFAISLNAQTNKRTLTMPPLPKPFQSPHLRQSMLAKAFLSYVDFICANVIVLVQCSAIRERANNNRY